MSAEAGPAMRTLVRDGVDAYAQVLAAAGGAELEVLMRQQASAGVCAAIYASPPYALEVPALPVARVSVNLTRSSVSGGVRGARAGDYEALRHSMFHVPAGVAVAWRKPSPSRHLTIYFDARVLNEGEGDVDAAPGFDPQQPLFNVQVAGIGALADQLAAELQSPDTLTVEAADSLARLLLVRLARRAPRAADHAATPLSPQLLGRLHDYVQAHLSQRILVADLARLAGSSPNRFAQAFSTQTQHSPHQFVLAARLRHAQGLLRTSRLTLVEVAHACGFANQQHLSNTMRRHLGVTPGRYRRAPEPHAAVSGEPRR